MSALYNNAMWTDGLATTGQPQQQPSRHMPDQTARTPLNGRRCAGEGKKQGDESILFYREICKHFTCMGYRGTKGPKGAERSLPWRTKSGKERQEGTLGLRRSETHRITTSLVSVPASTYYMQSRNRTKVTVALTFDSFCWFLNLIPK